MQEAQLLVFIKSLIDKTNIYYSPVNHNEKLKPLSIHNKIYIFLPKLKIEKKMQ